MPTDDERQRSYWDREHGHRPWDHPVVALFAEQRLNELHRVLDLRTIDTALDVGCGDGFSSVYLSRRGPAVVGMDRSQKMLVRHPLKPEGRVLRGDVRTLPFADNSFDLVFCWEVLHHVGEPELALVEMARVSRRYVLAAEPNRWNLFQAGFALVDREHRWVLRYSLGYLRRLARQAGLKPVAAWSGGWIFPNRCPAGLARPLTRLPYRSPAGISVWILAEKRNRGAV